MTLNEAIVKFSDKEELWSTETYISVRELEQPVYQWHLYQSKADAIRWPDLVHAYTRSSITRITRTIEELIVDVTNEGHGEIEWDYRDANNVLITQRFVVRRVK